MILYNTGTFFTFIHIAVSQFYSFQSKVRLSQRISNTGNHFENFLEVTSKLHTLPHSISCAVLPKSFDPYLLNQTNKLMQLKIIYETSMSVKKNNFE